MIVGADRIAVFGFTGLRREVLDADLATLYDAIHSVTQTSTPATGSNGTQFIFKNANGDPISSIRSIEAWISDVNGAPVTAITSFAALTNGNVDVLVVGKIYNVQCTAAGLLGITFTGTAATRYVTFRLPSGRLLTSTAIVIN